MCWHHREGSNGIKYISHNVSVFVLGASVWTWTKKLKKDNIKMNPDIFFLHL